MSDHEPNQEQLRSPLRTPKTEPGAESPELSPNEHLDLMLELCKPESMPLIRRWVSALMLVPKDQRKEIVEAVERQIVADFAD